MQPLKLRLRVVVNQSNGIAGAFKERREAATAIAKDVGVYLINLIISRVLQCILPVLPLKPGEVSLRHPSSSDANVVVARNVRRGEAMVSMKGI